MSEYIYIDYMPIDIYHLLKLTSSFGTNFRVEVFFGLPNKIKLNIQFHNYII